MNRHTIIEERELDALLPNSPDAVVRAWALWLRSCAWNFTPFPSCILNAGRVSLTHTDILRAFARHCTAAALPSLILSIQPVH